jgi:hypothetical protein
MNMRVFHLFNALLSAKILIKDSDGQEVGADRALERSRDLNHPVDHLGAVLFANVVSV